MERWLLRVADIFSQFPAALWANVNKSGSRLSDLEIRTHAMLQEIAGWVSGAGTVQDRHISQADGKRWEDHTNVSGNPHKTHHAELVGVDYTAAHTATSIANVPAGNLAATTVQGALAELDSEKAKVAGDLAQPFGSQTVTTSAIGGAGGQPWRLGTVKADTVALSTGSYVEVEINGVVVKLAVVA